MLLLRSFFLGIIAALLALFFEAFFSFSPGFNFELLFQQASWILGIFVFIEELLKLSFIWKNFSLNIRKVSGFHFFFQSIFVGLGFAITEAALKFLILLPREVQEPAFYIPILCAIFLHISISGLMGFFIFINTSQLNLGTFIKILIFSFGWHLLFNFFVIYSSNYKILSIFILFLIFSVVLTGYKIAIRQKTYTQ